MDAATAEAVLDATQQAGPEQVQQALFLMKNTVNELTSIVEQDHWENVAEFWGIAKYLVIVLLVVLAELNCRYGWRAGFLRETVWFTLGGLCVVGAMALMGLLFPYVPSAGGDAILLSWLGVAAWSWLFYLAWCKRTILLNECPKAPFALRAATLSGTAVVLVWVAAIAVGLSNSTWLPAAAYLASMESAIGGLAVGVIALLLLLTWMRLHKRNERRARLSAATGQALPDSGESH